MQKLARVTPPPSPLMPQKGLFLGLEGQTNLFSAEKQFLLPWTFSIAGRYMIKYHFWRLIDRRQGMSDLIQAQICPVSREMHESKI